MPGSWEAGLSSSATVGRFGHCCSLKNAASACDSFFFRRFEGIRLILVVISKAELVLFLKVSFTDGPFCPRSLLQRLVNHDSTSS